MFMSIKKKPYPKTVLMKTGAVGNSKSFFAKLKLITFNGLISLFRYITYTGSTAVLRDVKKYINFFK